MQKKAGTVSNTQTRVTTSAVIMLHTHDAHKCVHTGEDVHPQEAIHPCSWTMHLGCEKSIRKRCVWCIRFIRCRSESGCIQAMCAVSDIDTHFVHTHHPYLLIFNLCSLPTCCTQLHQIHRSQWHWQAPWQRSIWVQEVACSELGLCIC